MPNKIKDFFLALSRQNFVTLLAGFLPSPFHYFLKKRCIDYKSEIEMIRIELLVVVSRMTTFKLAVSNHLFQTLTTLTPSESIGTMKLSKSKKKSISISKNINDLLGSSGDEDSAHCDRLKRFKP